MVGSITSPFMIFDVFDVLLAVKMCINYSFVHLFVYFQRVSAVASVRQVKTT